MNPIDDSDRLKPCPYCGADAEIGEEQDGGHFVQCINSACGASSALLFPLMDDVKHLLLERWNKRCDTGGDERRHVVCVCPDCARGPHRWLAAKNAAETHELKAAQEADELRAALESVRQYGSDTLSGRTDGPDDRDWQRAAVLEMTRRARLALGPNAASSGRTRSAGTQG